MIPKWRPDLIKISNFGQSLNGNDNGYFEWPAPATIEQLGLTQPLKLEAIYVKWECGCTPSAIQLDFEGGHKSELFAAENPDAKNERRVDLKGL